jgi:RNA polymerase sigma-70 factor (ECF subfamily)
MCAVDAGRSPDITRLLQEVRAGSGNSAEELMSAVYQDLRQVARQVMSGEDSQQTLQPTAIVNEAFLRLFKRGEGPESQWQSVPVDWQSRAHFLAVAARQMRLVLIDYARQKKAAKRGGGLKVSLEDAGPIAARPEHDFETIDRLLILLAEKDPTAAQIVELKFFGGLTDREAALAMGITTAKLRRDWEFARSWLRNRMGGKSGADTRPKNVAQSDPALPLR